MASPLAAWCMNIRLESCMTLSFPPIHATNSTRRVPISLPFPLTTLSWETVSAEMLYGEQYGMCASR